jgi:acetate kinase
LKPGSILVLNAGSSSLKFALYLNAQGQLRCRLRGQIQPLARQPRMRLVDDQGSVVLDQAVGPVAIKAMDAVDEVLRYLTAHGEEQDLAAVGHRVVHGGMIHADPVQVDDVVMARLDELVPLAPLHQPYNLAAIRALARRYPGLPQVACFDTAFHHSNSDLVQRYALPDALHQQGIRRYGFHGLSYAYIASVLPAHDVRAAQGRTIVLHLGNGASLCALRGGVSVASSMGFSAVDGIPMATRSGALDPGVILYLMRHLRMDIVAVEDLIYRQSGLFGVSGISGDMRVLSESTEARAAIAIELFVYRIVREIGSLTAALGGLDALVFTAGIGEHSADVRERVMAALGWMGVRPDPVQNAVHGPRISDPDSAISVLVIPTDEEWVIAEQTRTVLDLPAPAENRNTNPD